MQVFMGVTAIFIFITLFLIIVFSLSSLLLGPSVFLLPHCSKIAFSEKHFPATSFQISTLAHKNPYPPSGCICPYLCSYDVRCLLLLYGLFCLLSHVSSVETGLSICLAPCSLCVCRPVPRAERVLSKQLGDTLDATLGAWSALPPPPSEVCPSSGFGRDILLQQDDFRGATGASRNPSLLMA